MSTAKFHTARGFRAQCQAASGPVPLRPEFSPCSIAKGVSRFPQSAPRKLGDRVEEMAAQDPTFLCRSQDGKGTVRCFPVILRYLASSEFISDVVTSQHPCFPSQASRWEGNGIRSTDMARSPADGQRPGFLNSSPSFFPYCAEGRPGGPHPQIFSAGAVQRHEGTTADAG